MIKLAFDTQFWGVAFYECEVADLPLADSLDEPCLIQLKLNELAYYSASEALSNRAFFYGGSCVEYEKAIPKKMDLDNLKHAAYIEKYREAILQLAESSFTYSRYRPIFDDHLVRKFYRLWAEKSIQGLLDDVCFVVADDGVFKGFVTLKMSTSDKKCKIGLISVLSQFRGEGVAHRLILLAEAYAFSKGAKSLSVVTQSANIAAQNAYIKEGYHLKHTAHWFYKKTGIQSHDKV